MLQKPDDVLLSQHLAAAARAAGRHFAQAALHARLPALRSILQSGCDCAHRWRMLVTHRRLLEWNPSGDSDRNRRTDLVASFRTMWIAPVDRRRRGRSLWRLRGRPRWPWPRPYWASGSPPRSSPGGSAGRSPAARHRLTADQTIFLRKLARKTWAFFETFVGPEDHWLPPDNYQEHPVAVVAHRTSPTNMGLALLANLSAYDFGYISAGQLIERTANALHTMEALERHRGHFYNWYDTQSLKPLPPIYVSTVDSGNLAGHLLTLRPGLLALPDHKILGTRLFEGLSDTLRILVDAAAVLRQERLRAYTPRLSSLNFSRIWMSVSRSRPTTLAAARLCLEQLATSAAAVVADMDALDAEPRETRLQRGGPRPCPPMPGRAR